MWGKIFGIISQYLLLPILKDLAIWLKDYFQRKAEQKKRHEENKKKVQKYENGTDSSSSDDFNQLP